MKSVLFSSGWEAFEIFCLIILCVPQHGQLKGGVGGVVGNGNNHLVTSPITRGGGVNIRQHRTFTTGKFDA